jgi:hypothetical protein
VNVGKGRLRFDAIGRWADVSMGRAYGEELVVVR